MTQTEARKRHTPRLRPFFIAVFVSMGLILLMYSWGPARNPFSTAGAEKLTDLAGYPARNILALKLNHAVAAPHYDVGLFGNSRSLMVGRESFTGSGCNFFNFSIGGQSLRNSVAMAEILAQEKKAPRLLVISFDNLELQFWNHPEHLPVYHHVRLAAADSRFALSGTELSVYDKKRIVGGHVVVLWSTFKQAFAADYFMAGLRRFLPGDWNPPAHTLEIDEAYRPDGSRAQAPPTYPSRNDSFEPWPTDLIIDLLLEHDLKRLKALTSDTESGVESAIVYESPLGPRYAQHYRDNPRPVVKAHRDAFLRYCEALDLSCYPAPGPDAVEPQAAAWPDPSHPPAAPLGRYILQLARRAGFCASNPK